MMVVLVMVEMSHRMSLRGYHPIDAASTAYRLRPF
jgi:hypothetical protein